MNEKREEHRVDRYGQTRKVFASYVKETIVIEAVFEIEYDEATASARQAVIERTLREIPKNFFGCCCENGCYSIKRIGALTKPNDRY